MEIYKFKYLDCSKKENRIKLMKWFMKTFKLKEKPTKEQIGKFSKKLENKFNYSMKIIGEQSKDKISISVRLPGGSYSTFFVDSLIEAYIKECMIIKNLEMNKRKVPK